MKDLPGELHQSAKQLGEAIDAFGASAESLILTHKKDIINEQCKLLRLADAAINIYSMGCMISRASTSIQKEVVSAEYETMLVKAACNMVWINTPY